MKLFFLNIFAWFFEDLKICMVYVLDRTPEICSTRPNLVVSMETETMIKIFVRNTTILLFSFSIFELTFFFLSRFLLWLAGSDRKNFLSYLIFFSTNSVLFFNSGNIGNRLYMKWTLKGHLYGKKKCGRWLWVVFEVCNF